MIHEIPTQNLEFGFGDSLGFSLFTILSIVKALNNIILKSQG